MKSDWKCIYYQGSCIKEVDDSRRRLLFQIPGTFPVSRVWISMNLSKFEQSAGNGYYRKLWYKDDFEFHGFEIIGNYRHNLTVTGKSLARHCDHMHRHIEESIARKDEAEKIRRKRYNDQRGRY